MTGLVVKNYPVIFFNRID